MNNFEEELCALINKYNEENASGTPDYILAKYITQCLAAFNLAVNQREIFYGRGVK